MQQQRREIAMVIALQAFLECDDNEEKALELIDSMVDNFKPTNDIDNAYNTVYDARKNDHDVFEEANLILVNRGEDKIGFDETIDDVILRLARWIISEKAVNHYIQLGRNIERIVINEEED